MTQQLTGLARFSEKMTTFHFKKWGHNCLSLENWFNESPANTGLWTWRLMDLKVIVEHAVFHLDSQCAGGLFIYVFLFLFQQGWTVLFVWLIFFYNQVSLWKSKLVIKVKLSAVHYLSYFQVTSAGTWPFFVGYLSQCLFSIPPLPFFCFSGLCFVICVCMCGH